MTAAGLPEGGSMGAKEKSFKHYGVELREMDELKNKCRSLNGEQKGMLYRSCLESDIGLSEHIFYSLTTGTSYDNLNKINRVPINRDDFYGYRRKALVIFKSRLKLKQN